MSKKQWFIKAFIPGEQKPITNRIRADHAFEANRLFMKKLSVGEVCSITRIEISELGVNKDE